MSKKQSIARVLLIAFSVLLFHESMVKVYAATTDDLRVVIGERRVTDETLISDVKAMIYKYRQTQYRKELIELLKDKGNLDYEVTFNRLMKEKEERQASLEESFSSNKPVKEVLTDLSEVYSNLTELGALKLPNTYILEEFDEDDQELAYEYAKSVLSCMEEDFDLGEVGEGLRPPTLNNFHLEKAFGEYTEVLGTVTYKENDGIDLQVISDTSAEEEKMGEIVSQFNGTITEIRKKDEKYRITISHGVALQTIYFYLNNVKVKEGEEIKQYEVIGTTTSETIHFKIILNTVPINPLFLYGGTGERVYAKWVSENPGMVMEATDFSNVKKYVDDVSEPQVLIEPSTVIDGGVETDLKFEDGYVKPEVPVIDIYDYVESKGDE